MEVGAIDVGERGREMGERRKEVEGSREEEVVDESNGG